MEPITGLQAYLLAARKANPGMTPLAGDTVPGCAFPCKALPDPQGLTAPGTDHLQGAFGTLGLPFDQPLTFETIHFFNRQSCSGGLSFSDFMGFYSFLRFHQKLSFIVE
jgi:hypothetical protein